MARWSKPSPHVAKVNCKGVFDRARMRASVGCVMRNSRGEWIRGAAGMIGLVVPLGAELWSMFYGLKLAWEKGDTKHVVVECESQEALNAVSDPDPEFWLADLVDLIKKLESEAWESCRIEHVSVAGNKAATTLANSQLDGEGGIMELADAPAFMASVLAADLE